MNRQHFLRYALGAATLALAGCAGPQVSDYAAEKPTLDLREFFKGRVDAQGLFQDRSGRIVKRFTVVMDCRWEGDQGVLDEHFSYSDGSTQRRVWHLTRLPDGQYRGRADDVVGEAQGQVAGNALRWNYTLALPVDSTASPVRYRPRCCCSLCRIACRPPPVRSRCCWACIF